jgi:hypothetical protein
MAVSAELTYTAAVQLGACGETPPQQPAVAHPAPTGQPVKTSSQSPQHERLAGSTATGGTADRQQVLILVPYLYAVTQLLIQHLPWIWPRVRRRPSLHASHSSPAAVSWFRPGCCCTCCAGVAGGLGCLRHCMPRSTGCIAMLVLRHGVRMRGYVTAKVLKEHRR